jgi:hypothetical protein
MFYEYNHFRQIRKEWTEEWGRPKCDFSGDLSFQQIDLDKTLETSSGCDPRPVVRIYGTDRNGSSIACFVQNFKPYFYVLAPPDFTDEYSGQFQNELNGKVISEVKSGSQFRELRKGMKEGLVADFLQRLKNWWFLAHCYFIYGPYNMDYRS